ncbi:MAG: 30S ribosomal protein S9 [Chloroflexi bacterium]|nr:30S ribosomal protein S9 [Chloroflexota bacterium]
MEQAQKVRYYEGIGRRKEATARVRIMPGTGKFIVNDRPIEAYFTRFGDISYILKPFEVLGEARERYDITVRVKGGGITGQAGAVRLGLARAFLKMNPDYRPALRKAGLLTRDPREKERKKPGLKRARKAPTYTKR